MAKKTAHVSETPATQLLRRAGVEFSEHVYDYVEHGGTAESARQLAVDEHAVVKTLVMQNERGEPLVVLMHGDRQVSTKSLARAIGAKASPPARRRRPSARAATRSAAPRPSRRERRCRSTSRRASSSLARICINGGRRGYLIGIEPRVLVELLAATPVSCAQVSP